MKTKSAKEILIEESKSDPNFALLTGTMPVIERAMDEWAKIVAIDFAKYLKDNDYCPVDLSDKPGWIQFGGKNGWLQPGSSIVKTTERLFEFYKNEKQN